MLGRTASRDGDGTAREQCKESRFSVEFRWKDIRFPRERSLVAHRIGINTDLL